MIMRGILTAVRTCGVIIATSAALACGSSPATPTNPTPAPAPTPSPAPPAPEPTPPPAPPPPPPKIVASGMVRDVFSDNPVAGVKVAIDGIHSEVPTGTSGDFSIDVPTGFQDVTNLRVAGGAIWTRTIRVRVPGDPVTVSVTPASLDLIAFDQMFRPNGSLQRWTDPPRLVLQRRVLQYSTASTSEFSAINDLITDAQASELVSTLVAALPQLSGGRFTAFSSQQSETAAVGDRVSLQRTGDVYVVHVEGLLATGSAGKGSASVDQSGVVRGGYVILDRGYDTSGSFRRVARMHELGHALGYGHVTARDSVMNPSASIEPNGFDRDGAKLAFLRPPGNRSPDMDPVSVTSNARGGRVVWGPAVP
jgi:hypothetical protein